MNRYYKAFPKMLKELAGCTIVVGGLIALDRPSRWLVQHTPEDLKIPAGVVLLLLALLLLTLYTREKR